MMVDHYNAHPIASIFPMIKGDAFDHLVDDIKNNGLAEPIVLYQRMILDGRNRYQACIRAGIEPKFIPYTGSDPVQFVMTHNFYRRQLTKGQQALSAVKAAKMLEEAGKFKTEAKATAADWAAISVTSLDKAEAISKNSVLAEAVASGETSLESATVVLKEASPELLRQVENKETSVNTAATTIRQERPFNEKLNLKNYQDKMRSELRDMIRKIREYTPANDPSIEDENHRQNRRLFQIDEELLEIILDLAEASDHLKNKVMVLRSKKTVFA
jgi:ParB-like chromosome segregation protein Spo0J